ncbi:MAG: OprD family outer membrane porin, partial [Sulfurovum sp.]|nr:OprD family outer membrane porin [Sulfurovum sp.]
MKKIILSTIVIVSVSGAADTLLKMFSQGKAHGNIKYYYIQTDKQNDTPYKDTSANANAVGGQLGFETASLTGWKLKTTFMFTNGFLLDDPVDTSILSRDNGIRLGTGAGGKDAQESFAVLGEALISYSVENFSINYGRQVIKTPLIHAKEVRMLPSAVQGAMASYRFDTAKLDISGGYLTHFKQRTSDQFINIQKHALGAKMRPMLVGNPDLVAPRGSYMSIEPGYFAWMLHETTGVEPQNFGKPHARVFEQAKQRILQVLGLIDPARVL